MVKPVTKRYLNPSSTFSQDLSTAALSHTTSIGRAFRLDKVHLRASQNITETVTVTGISKDGTAYNSVLRSRTLSAQRDFVFRPDGEDTYRAGDEIKVECTNSNGTGTVSGAVETSQL